MERGITISGRLGDVWGLAGQSLWLTGAGWIGMYSSVDTKLLVLEKSAKPTIQL